MSMSETELDWFRNHAPLCGCKLHSRMYLRQRAYRPVCYVFECQICGREVTLLAAMAELQKLSYVDKRRVAVE